MPARRLAKACAGSAKNITPNREATRSISPGGSFVDHGVGVNEARRNVLGRAVAGAPQQKLGDVDAERLAFGRDAGGELERRRAAAAADVHDELAGPASATSSSRSETGRRNASFRS